MKISRTVYLVVGNVWVGSPTYLPLLLWKYPWTKRLYLRSTQLPKNLYFSISLCFCFSIQLWHFVSIFVILYKDFINFLVSSVLQYFYFMSFHILFQSVEKFWVKSLLPSEIIISFLKNFLAAFIKTWILRTNRILVSWGMKIIYKKIIIFLEIVVPR